MAARQPAYLNIVKQEQGHGPTTECLAAVPVAVAVTNEERNRKPGMSSAVATVPFTGVKRAAAPASVTPWAAVQDMIALKQMERPTHKKIYLGSLSTSLFFYFSQDIWLLELLVLIATSRCPSTASSGIVPLSEA